MRRGPCRGQAATGSLHVALGLLAALAFALPGPAASQEPAAAPPASAAPAQRRLEVVVTGGGKPIPEAEVLFSAQNMPDKKMFTNDKGMLSWSPPAVPKVKIRVIASGWSTYRNEIPLAGLPLRHEVALAPMQAASAASR